MSIEIKPFIVDLNQAWGFLKNVLIYESSKTILQTVKDVFDYIILDDPPSAAELAQNEKNYLIFRAVTQIYETCIERRMNTTFLFKILQGKKPFLSSTQIQVCNDVIKQNQGAFMVSKIETASSLPKYVGYGIACAVVGVAGGTCKGQAELYFEQQTKIKKCARKCLSYLAGVVVGAVIGGAAKGLRTGTYDGMQVGVVVGAVSGFVGSCVDDM